MKNRILNLAYLCFVTILVASCGIPKETLLKVESNEKKIVDFPIEYCNDLPTPTFEQWDKDFDEYNKFLTKTIMKTQMGMSYIDKGVKTWWCNPSARPHVQLDSTTMINDLDLVKGEWRAVCNRQIVFKDSCSYSDQKIYRSSELVHEGKERDVVLVVTDDKFKMYERLSENENFKSKASNYHIENKRFLMLYKTTLASAAIAFIGLDKEGRLIINSFSLTERKKENETDREYIVYNSDMVQLIFERL